MAATPTPNPVRYMPDVETIEADEIETSRQLNDTLRGIMETTAQDYGHAVRGVHAKSHGFVEGELIVPELPLVLAQGIFARPGTYKAIGRISTNPGDVLDDSVSVPRGFALKILDVAGERLEGSEGDTTQDFVLVNGPAFFAPGTKFFLQNLKLLAKTTDKLDGVKKAQSFLLRAVEGAIEAVGLKSATLTSLGGQPAVHPLGDAYYSQVPFRFGDHIAKIGLFPVSPNLTDLTGSAVNVAARPDALREVVDEALAAGGGEWELRVQLATDLEKMPIEDASKQWDEAESPYVTVARLRVAPQRGWTPDRAKVGDDQLLFSVWHGVEAHRPLGQINRARKSAYEMSARFRGEFNKCPIHEPRGDVQLEDSHAWAVTH